MTTLVAPQSQSPASSQTPSSPRPVSGVTMRFVPRFANMPPPLTTCRAARDRAPARGIRRGRRRPRETPACGGRAASRGASARNICFGSTRDRVWRASGRGVWPVRRRSSSARFSPASRRRRRAASISSSGVGFRISGIGVGSVRPMTQMRGKDFARRLRGRTSKRLRGSSSGRAATAGTDVVDVVVVVVACLRAGHHHNNNIARGDDHQPPDGGFGRTENAQDVIVEMARQGRAGLPVNQPGHGEQRRENAQERLAVAGNRPVPVDRAFLARSSFGQRVREVSGRWISWARIYLSPCGRESDFNILASAKCWKSQVRGKSAET